MENEQAPHLKQTLVKCCKCHKEIKMGEEYTHDAKFFCLDCCIDLRMPRARKTHWQYLSRIKSEYLRPGSDD